MLLKLNDTLETRVVLSAITSFVADYDVNYLSNSRVETIVLSIGSVLKTIKYDSEYTRDLDLKALDTYFTCGQ